MTELSTDVVLVEKPVADATLELTNEQIERIFEGRVIEDANELGCTVATITPNESYAHVNLSKFANLRRSDNSKFPTGKYYLHHLAALKEHGPNKLKAVYRPSTGRAKNQMQVSHLCHNS